jgi:hypothetical protein
MNLQAHITREQLSSRGGGVELDLTAFGYEDEYLSAYQNYLGGGMLGGIGNSCTVEGWQVDERLVRLAQRLSEYFQQRMEELAYIDEYNEMTIGRPIQYPGL